MGQLEELVDCTEIWHRIQGDPTEIICKGKKLYQILLHQHYQNIHQLHLDKQFLVHLKDFYCFYNLLLHLIQIYFLAYQLFHLYQLYRLLLHPFIFPICETVIPTAPAAPETNNVSFSLGLPISNNPKYAVNPVTPSTPR